MERRARAGLFPQGFAIGRDSLFETRRPALLLAETKERSAKFHLGLGPIERRALVGLLF